MTTSIQNQEFCVVYFACYAPEGYRAYDYNDQYLEDYPSMGTILEARYASMEEAQAAADDLNAEAFLADLESIWSDMEAKGMTI